MVKNIVIGILIVISILMTTFAMYQKAEADGKREAAKRSEMEAKEQMYQRAQCEAEIAMLKGRSR